MTDRDDSGKYEHEFVELGKNKDLCMLCMESADNHQLDSQEMDSQDYILNMENSSRRQEIRNSFLARQSSREKTRQGSEIKQSVIAFEKITCEICYSDVDLSECFRFDCGHRFCL